MSMRFFLPLFLFASVIPLISAAQKEDTASSFAVSLQIHEGMERGGSFLLPAFEWEKGLHRLKAGFAVGPGYQGRKGAKGGEWAPGSEFNSRGAALSYGVRVWSPSNRVRIHAGLWFYYLGDSYQAEKGELDPRGREYASKQKASRMIWAGAPFLELEFRIGKGFSLGLGFQPLRYQRSTYEWEGENDSFRTGRAIEQQVFRQQVGARYRF